MFSVDRGQFGPNFVFGAATAAYQIEGGQTDGRGTCIWDTFAATPGNVKNADDGRNADDHYNRWPQDLDLIRDGGFGAYRFSIAWPRLLPEGTGAINQAGIDFYDRLIDGMLERGIKPFATLYHWDLPSALQDKGGWMNRDIGGWFAEYAALVAHNFGDRLHATATINEPWCVSVLSHILGGSRSSRLNQALREKARLVSGISGWYGALQGAGAIGVTAQLEGADQEAVERGILAEIRRIQTDGVTPEELARSITASEAQREFSRETVEGLALAYGRAEMTWSLEAERAYLDRVRAVTGAQVQAAARRYLGDSYARLAFVPRGRAQ